MDLNSIFHRTPDGWYRGPYKTIIGQYQIKLFPEGDINGCSSGIYKYESFEISIIWYTGAQKGCRLDHEDLIALDIHLEKYYYDKQSPLDWNPHQVPINVIENIVDKLMLIVNPIPYLCSYCEKCEGKIVSGTKLCWACEHSV